MGRKFEPDIDMYENLGRRKRSQLVSFFLLPFGVFCITKCLTVLDMLDEKNSTFRILLNVACLIMMVLSVVNYRKLFVVYNNLPRCYLEVEETRLSGYAFDKIHENDNGSYFEVNYEEIRSVNLNYNRLDSFLDLYNADNFYNLIIHSSKGTHKFYVGNAGEAKKQIEGMIQRRKMENN